MDISDEFQGMISYEAALSRVLAHAWQVEDECVALEDALGRVLAQDAESDMDMPPFDKSAVDGYACRNEDTHSELKVVGIIPAGVFPEHVLQAGETMKIMTGAPLPPGADCVVMKEHVEEVGESGIRVTDAHAGKTNYCLQGEDVRVGNIVLKRGTRILPQHAAILASVGLVNPRVSRKVKVGVFSTGTELVDPKDKPGAGKIRNSNSTQIAGQAESKGAEVRRYGMVADTKEALMDTVRSAMDENDIVISTGGVSVGDFDLMPEIYAEAGATIHVRKVAIQPGKPVIFATSGQKAFFGLSGNPMSSFLQFELFVAPLLQIMSGVTEQSGAVYAPLAQAVSRKHTQRMQWFPVKFQQDGTIAPVKYHGSAHIHALGIADALVAYPVGVEQLAQGEMLRVLLLRPTI